MLAMSRLARPAPQESSKIDRFAHATRERGPAFRDTTMVVEQ